MSAPHPQADLVRRLQEYWSARTAAFEEWAARGFQHPPPRRQSTLPEDASELRCGAKTRAGTPCKRRDVYANGRCKLHGGLSTGPRTAEGKRRSAANLPNSAATLREQ